MYTEREIDIKKQIYFQSLFVHYYFFSGKNFVLAMMATEKHEYEIWVDSG